MRAPALAFAAAVVVFSLTGCHQGAKISPVATTSTDPTADPALDPTATPPSPDPVVDPTATPPPDPVVDPTTTPTPDPLPATTGAMTGTVRIGYLHHSVGGIIWAGGNSANPVVKATIDAWNAAHGTRYEIEQIDYPKTTGGYPWANFPYDYWNLWVNHTTSVSGELTYDQLLARYDVIVFKHCFDGSLIDADEGTASISSSVKSRQNYLLQYAALKTRLNQSPNKRFLLWTLPAVLGSYPQDQATRARDFTAWVKSTWDQKGDNIYLFDFRDIETKSGGLYLPSEYATTDSHPNKTFAAIAAPLLARRIIQVIRGEGDSGSLTGR